MIKAILVDDEPRGLASLKKMLSLECPQVSVVAECLNAESAIEKVKLLDPQLLFLDISMPRKNGFDLLNEIEDIRFELIFTTAYNEYSLQAFRYSAVDYLMKPIDEDLLKDAVERALKRIQACENSAHIETLLYNLKKLQMQGKMKLCLPSLKGFEVINLDEIIFCEAQSSYTNFYLVNNTQILASKAISEYELLLQDTTFCRVHKSYLVNLAHVKEYKRGEGGSLVLTNDKTVEVSRRKKEDFFLMMKRMFKY